MARAGRGAAGPRAGSPRNRASRNRSNGTRPAFLAGIGGFGLACGLAPAPGVLLAARAVQGLAGALVMPATLTMITAAYTDTRARFRALGLWSAVGAAGAAAGTVAGTVAGGVLTDLAGWRWVFLVSVPVTLGAVLAGLRALPAPAPMPWWLSRVLRRRQG